MSMITHKDDGHAARIRPAITARRTALVIAPWKDAH